MNRTVIDIPRGFFRNMSFNWDIDWRGQTSGETNSGNTQIVNNAFPRWVGQPTISLRGQDIARWRAIRARARGQVNLYRLEMCDRVTGGGQSNLYPNGLPFSNSQPFSTGFGFSYRPFYTAKFDALKGATSFFIETATPPRVGQFMSHDDWPFVVVSVEDVGVTTRKVTVEMPLRSAIKAGEAIYQTARGIFEATDGSMGLPSYGSALLSTPQLSFREVLSR